MNRRIISFFLAVIFLFGTITAFAKDLSLYPPQSYTLTNIFESEYGYTDDKLTPTVDISGEGIACKPNVYTFYDDGSIYVWDAYNPNEKLIKHYDKEGRYLNSINPSAFLGERENMVDMVICGDTLYILTDTSVLYAYDIKAGTVRSYVIEAEYLSTPCLLIGYDKYVVAAYIPHVAFVYEGFAFLYYAFDTENHSVSDDPASARFIRNGEFDSITEFDWFGLHFELQTYNCIIPLGQDADGNFILTENEYGGCRTDCINKNSEIVCTSHYKCHNYSYHPLRMEQGKLYHVENSYACITDSGTIEKPTYTVNSVIINNESQAVSEELFSLPIVLIFAEGETAEDTLCARLDVYAVRPSVAPYRYAVTESGDFYIMNETAPMDGAFVLSHFDKDGNFIKALKPSDIYLPFSDDALGLAGCIGNTLYISGMVYGNSDAVQKIVCYDTDSGEITVHDYPPMTWEEMMLVSGVYFLGKYILCDVYEGIKPLWAFDTEKREFVDPDTVIEISVDEKTRIETITFEGEKYKVSIPDGYSHATVLGMDEEGCLYTQYDVMPWSEVIGYYTVYQKTAKDGKVLSLASDIRADIQMIIEKPAAFMNNKLYRARSTMYEYAIDILEFDESFLTENTYDANLDGRENTEDAVCILRFAAGMDILYMSQQVKADVNGDHRTNTADAVKVLKKCAGMILNSRG